MKRRALLVAVAVGLITAGLGARQARRSPHRRCSERPRVPEHRADAHDRPRRGCRDRSEEPERLVCRLGVRRPVENRSTAASASSRSSTTTPSRSAASSSIRRTLTSSGSAPARTTASAARTSATASTNPPTPARRGNASASRSPSTSARSWSIRATPTSCMSRHRVRCSPAGGDRGLYKTTDGGATWNKVLNISDDTGISDIVFDPKNADVIFASAYQRRRAVGQMIGGGPEGGIFKTTDGGKTWTKLTQGAADRRYGPRRPRRRRTQEPGNGVRARRREAPRVGFLPLG